MPGKCEKDDVDMNMELHTNWASKMKVVLIYFRLLLGILRVSLFKNETDKNIKLESWIVHKNIEICSKL